MHAYGRWPQGALSLLDRCHWARPMCLHIVLHIERSMLEPAGSLTAAVFGGVPVPPT
jgi:hypothetical protein